MNKCLHRHPPPADLHYRMLALFDTVLCSENNIFDVEALLLEMLRVLRVGGTYLVVSHGLPDNRLSYFKRFLTCNISVLSVRKYP